MTLDQFWKLKEAGRITLLAVLLVLTSPLLLIVNWMYDDSREQYHCWRLRALGLITLVLAFRVLMWVDSQ